MHTTIIDSLKRKHILTLLDNGTRSDGRALDQPRELKIEPGVIPKAEGSARVFLGDTQIVTGVKVQPDRPFPDTGDRGMLMCTAEILPLAHPDAEPGPPNEKIIELARVVDRGIRESHMIDLSKLVIEQNKSVVGVFTDNSVIDDCGNLFDACSFASVAALNNTKLPKWEMNNDIPTLVEGDISKLPILTVPVSVTMIRIDDHIIVDPNADEWLCLDARVTITSDSDGNICALQKGGNGGFTMEQLIQCGELATSIGKDIRKILKDAV